MSLPGSSPAVDNRGHRRDGGGHPSRPVALRPAGTQRISVHFRCIIPGCTKTLESDWGVPVSVRRGYGTGRIGGANKAQTAIVVSHSSIVVPYFLGVTLALFLYRELAQPGASFLAFALFSGISMSITAFPVLVRILQDHGIFKTPLGSTATACAAAGDVTAWIMLAFVVAIARVTSVGGAVFNLGLVLVFIALMLFVIKPKTPNWIGQQALERPNPSKAVLGLVLGVVFVSALTTELIGIHALFGAFLAGIVMPTACGFRDKLVVRVENLTRVLLLPVFFAFTACAPKSASSTALTIGWKYLPSHYRGSHCGKTRWKRSGCSSTQ